MAETMQIVFTTIQNYRGNGLYPALFLLALLYLFLTEPEKSRRIMLIYASLTILGIFVFPLSAYIIMHGLMDTEIYYRQLWLLPCGITVCYALTRMVMRTGKKTDSKRSRAVRKITVAAAGAAVLILTGTNVYTNGNYDKAENPYHIPQYTIHVCDTILSDDLEYTMTAAFPQSMVEYVRQYTAEIMTTYGRGSIIDRWVEQWNMGNELLDLIEAESYDAQELAAVSREQGVECIVLYGFKEMNGHMEDYHFTLVDSVDGYDIYMEEWLAAYHIDKESDGVLQTSD